MKDWLDITKRTRIERWKNVLRVLEAMTPHERKHHWNMAFWGRRTDCGTVACAAGHCGMDPWFRARGFKMSFGYFSERVIEKEWTDPVVFFGHGATTIFYNDTRRPVESVINEVKFHIGNLKNALS